MYTAHFIIHWCSLKSCVLLLQSHKNCLYLQGDESPLFPFINCKTSSEIFVYDIHWHHLFIMLQGKMQFCNILNYWTLYKPSCLVQFSYRGSAFYQQRVLQVEYMMAFSYLILAAKLHSVVYTHSVRIQGHFIPYYTRSQVVNPNASILMQNFFHF